MSEPDMADDLGAPLDWRSRLGGGFLPRLISRPTMAAVAAIVTFSGTTPFAILVIVVTVLLSWEWGHLVHGREANAAIAVHVVAASVAAVLAAFVSVGLGLLALPIGAILAMLLSL